MFGLLYEENLRFSHPLVVAIELKQEKKKRWLQMEKTYLKFKMFAEKERGRKWIGLRKKKVFLKGKK